ncbi:conserved hypothetical protein [delta proteobacterium NaphS2]|nr:conserved hypothetical protein [delta proteobacterium NaphS2]
MERIKPKDTDTFVERLLKNYIWWKLRHKGAVMLFGEFGEGKYGKKAFYIALFDDAVWIAEHFKRPLFDLKGVPLVVIPTDHDMIDYLSKWITLQTKNVAVQKTFKDLPIQEIEQKFLH